MTPVLRPHSIPDRSGDYIPEANIDTESITLYCAGCRKEGKTCVGFVISDRNRKEREEAKERADSAVLEKTY